jgi:hypothetical protein
MSPRKPTPETDPESNKSDDRGVVFHGEEPDDERDDSDIDDDEEDTNPRIVQRSDDEGKADVERDDGDRNEPIE